PHHADYAARINRVFDYIDAHLAEPLDLARLAAVAYVSPWHFHRIFQALTGETLADRVRRRRVEAAATRLLADPPLAALTVALDVGFGSAEVFTRAFRAHFGVTPTAWRRGAHREWSRQHVEQLRKIRQANRKRNQAAATAFDLVSGAWPLGHHPRPKRRGDKTMDVEIKNLPEARVAYMRYVGPYGSSEITEMWQRFDVWARAQGFMSPRRRMWGVSQDNPKLTAPDKLRYDACVEVEETFKPSGEIGVQTIRGGRYACARFTGTAAEIAEAWMRFLREWLPRTRLQCDDAPALELYDTDFTIDPKTYAFSCLLCMPVKG
ncbi:MAG TPA: GyrI-like domain-containing protein, partial [Thermoanaerobaculia bacterium]|nr:GyrI-like domain-containing protein [Thermoanaerobaculia bacterium]